MLLIEQVIIRIFVGGFNLSDQEAPLPCHTQLHPTCWRKGPGGNDEIIIQTTFKNSFKWYCYDDVLEAKCCK